MRQQRLTLTERKLRRVRRVCIPDLGQWNSPSFAYGRDTKYAGGDFSTMAPYLVRILALAVAGCVMTRSGRAESTSNVRFEIAIHDLPADSQSLDATIRENILVAAGLWTSLFVTKPVSVEIDLTFKPWANRGAGRSLTAVPLGGEKVDGRTVIEEGLPHELRTGNDPNGTTPDVEIILDPEYAKTMWWDPKPRSRTRPVPIDKLDGFSVILHELGHAMGYNGRLDPKTGRPTGGEISTYDRWVEFDGNDFAFTGPAATKVYRKKVPLSHTVTNYHHFGEPGPKLDRNLKEDLMNGIVMQYGRRYKVSALDIAILSDCGLEVSKR